MNKHVNVFCFAAFSFVFAYILMCSICVCKLVVEVNVIDVVFVVCVIGRLSS